MQFKTNIIRMEMTSMEGNFFMIFLPPDMVPTDSDGSNIRTFQGPSQDQISCYKDFYNDFHNANVPKLYHVYVVTC